MLRSTALFGLALLAPAAFTGCDSDGGGTTADLEARATLTNVATHVITATYADLATESSGLLTAVTLLQNSATAGHLEAARAQWRAARTPWEQSEGFLFGPVDTQALDPSLDSWPVNVVDLDAVLASSAPLTPSYVAALGDAGLRGFHTIEYLLWGAEGQKTAADFTAREFEYLVAATTVLRDDAATLADAWRPGGGDFAAELVEAGEEGSLYVSQRDAVQQLVEGLAGIAEEVGTGKISGPYSEHDATLEESRFSANSLADFQDNIRSVRNVYLGDYGATTGAGITDLVAARDAALDARVRSEIDAAIAAIGAIPAPFSTALLEENAAIDAAVDAVVTLQVTLSADVSAALLD
jgi:putative iron-regulated protein